MIRFVGPFVWCWDEHAWVDITCLGAAEREEICESCGARRHRPLPEIGVPA